MREFIQAAILNLIPPNPLPEGEGANGESNTPIMNQPLRMYLVLLFSSKQTLQPQLLFQVMYVRPAFYKNTVGYDVTL